MSQNLRVAELDFDQIKENLINFMASKPEFSDYNFTGSGLNVIIDLLAYNTHYNGVITNMLASEVFLDTAIKRETVSLHAKRLGYLPRSARSPYALINLEVFPTGYPSTLTIGKGATFLCRIDTTTTLQFVTRDATTIQVDENFRYIFPSLKVYEGSIETFRYQVNVNDPTQRFEIPTNNADISTLRVFVQESISNTAQTEYTLVTDISKVNSTSTVYYLKTNELGFYEVYFGDSVLGKAIQDGNVIGLEYIVTNKTLGNGASKFTFTDSVEGNTSVLITTVAASIGGAEPETIEQIKENAQKAVLAQNRAVTASDYKAIIPELFPVESVVVWGGEENVPPVYGKVFMSLKLNNSTDTLSDSQKEEVKSLLKEKKILGITPEIVDPQFLYGVIDTTVSYNANKSSYSTSTMKSLVMNSIKSFVTSNLNKFEQKLLYSSLVGAIDDTDSSITSNLTSLKLKKIVDPLINQDAKYTIDFQNPILPSTLSSSGFTINDVTYTMYIEDDGLGSVYMYYNLNGTKTVYSKIGSINYVTGVITIPSLLILNITGLAINFLCSPSSLNVIPQRSTIISVLDADISITVTAS